MKDRRLIVIALACLLLLALWRLLPSVEPKQELPRPVARVGDVPASEAKDYTFDVGDGAVLEFPALAGNITIQASPPGPIKATVTKRSFGIDDASALRELQSFDVQPQQKGKTVSFPVSAAVGPGRQFDCKITTPPSVSVKIAGGNGSGSVTIGGTHGSVDISGDNVNVMLLDIRGPITIRNRAGSLKVADSIGATSIRSQISTIQIDRLTADSLDITTGANTVLNDSGTDSGTDSGATFQVAKGDLTLTRFRAKTLVASAPGGQLRINESTADAMDLQTQAGKIHLFRVAAAKLHATTTTGQLEMDQIQGDLDITTTGGAVYMSEMAITGLRIAAGAGNVEFDGTLPTAGEHTIHTSSGNIDIVVAKETAFRLDASTTGTITIDPPFVLAGADRAATRWRGIINNGTALLNLTSTSGKIFIGSQ